MRYLFIVIISALLFQLRAYSAYSQNLLKGNWTVGCSMKRESFASMTRCPLCATDETSGSYRIKDMDWTVTNDSIAIVFSAKEKQTIAYNWESETDNYSFAYDSSQYKFQLFLNGCILVLQDGSGNILTLQKKEK